MKTIFHNKWISGMLVVLPETEVLFEDEVASYSFPERQTLRLKKVMGYEKHRIAKASTAASDMCVYALRYALEHDLISKEEIGAIIVVTVTPDHFMPHTANVIQGECDIPSDVVCFDIMQGCCGFELGLMQAFMLLDHMPGKKALLFNTDVLSHKVSLKDRNSYPLIGDAASMTVVENDAKCRDIYFNMLMDGGKRDALTIPAGGSRLPCSSQTTEQVLDNEGNYRSLDNLKMNGAEIFSFVQTEVPPMIRETLEYAGIGKEYVEWYLFHQPNRFMLQKLVDRIGVPREKAPMNVVEKYGNPSGASIPLVIADNLRSEMKKQKQLCCLSAFGAGMAWSAIVMELGDMKFCELLISNC